MNERQEAVNKMAEELENLRGIEDVVDQLEDVVAQVEAVTMAVHDIRTLLPALIQALAPLAHLRTINDHLDAIVQRI
jgi:DNA-binding transcriptional regulator GbsR (MarR family)